MADFDLSLWNERAWARLCRGTQKNGKRDEAAQARLETQWFQDVRSSDDISRVVDWCSVRCIKVSFVKRPYGLYKEKEIDVSSRLRPLNQLVVLLHECGHHLVGGADRADRFLMGYPQTDPKVKRTFHHRVACLEEELEAWHRGWRLSRRLGLTLTRQQFDSVRLDCIRSYVKWTLRPGAMSKE